MTNTYAPILGAYDIHLKDFSFYPDKHTNTRDAKTGQTICNLVASQFQDNLTVMTYTCDEGDEKQALRQYKFEKWVERYMPKYEYQPITITVETGEGPYNRFAGLLYPPGFNEKEAMLVHLLDKIGTIFSEKNGM